VIPAWFCLGSKHHAVIRGNGKNVFSSVGQHVWLPGSPGSRWSTSRSSVKVIRQGHPSRSSIKVIHLSILSPHAVKLCDFPYKTPMVKSGIQSHLTYVRKQSHQGHPSRSYVKVIYLGLLSPLKLANILCHDQHQTLC